MKGSISNRVRVYNSYNKRWLLDETAKNLAYIEYPTGSTVSANMTNYFNGPAKTNNDDSTIPVGYTRHYREISDSPAHFNLWQANSNINSNYQSIDTTFNPPATLNVGDNFHITVGIVYKKVNGKLQEKKAISDYVKQEQQNWQLTSTDSRRNTGSVALAIVDLSNNSSVSTANYVFGYSNYYHSWTGKNTGKRDILIRNSHFIRKMQIQKSEFQFSHGI